MDSQELVLGIDGGATKTVAWLAPRASAAASPCVGRGIAGPSNFQGIDPAEALANLDRAIDAAFADAGMPRGPLAAAVFALAGSDREEVRQPVRLWAATQQIAPRIAVVHDALAVLAAGSPERWGVALIAGTGSLAFGRGRDGRTARAGGWGFLFGDEGSAYTLAVAGLRAAARGADGRGPATEILPALLHRFNVPDAASLVAAVYPLAADRATIASLATLVTAAAATGDPVAKQLLDEAARELAAMVNAVAEKLDFSSAEFPLALAGGLLLGNPPMRDQLVAGLHALGLRPTPIATVADPVAGAVRLAQQQCLQSGHEGTSNTF